MITCRRFSRLFVVLTLLLLVLPVASAGPARQPAESPAAAPLAAGDTSQGGDMLTSTALNSQSDPDIAYNTADEEYLVVWSDRRNEATSSGDIYGQIFSTEGVPQGEPIAVCTDAADQYYASVAYSSIDNQYLVVWNDYRNGNWDIYGQIVEADGSLAGSDFAVNSDPGTQDLGDVVHNADPASNDYLVVWYDMAQTAVEGQLLDEAGSPIGSLLAIADSSSEPRAAYNSNRNSYMVVFQDNAVWGDANVAGRAIAADGSMDPRFDISTAASSQTMPAIAFNSTAPGYLVVWQDGRDQATTGNDIYGQRIDEDGNTQGGEITVCNSGEGQFEPVLAYSPDSNQYLVAWDDDRNSAASSTDVYGQRVKADGSLADQGNFVISNAPGAQYLGSVAYGGALYQYLAVWGDHRSGRWDIYGQRLHWLGLPTGNEFGVSAASEGHEEPDIAYNSTEQEYLIVWADDRDGDGEADIWGQRYSAAGRPLGQNFAVREESGNETNAVVTYNPADNNYLVVWEDETEGDVEGQILTAQGGPIDQAFNIADGAAPAVAYNSISNFYLVAFEQSNVDTGYDIYARHISATGVLPELQEFAVCEETGDQRAPAIVFNGHNYYQVVWEDHRDDPGDILGRVVHANQTVDPEVVIAQENDAQSAPDLACNSTDNEYLAVWHDYRDSGTTGADVYGYRLDSAGAPLDNEIVISTADDDQMHPYVNYVSANNQYYVGWADNQPGTKDGWDLHGRWITADGSAGSFVLPAFSYAGWQQYPAGAYDPDNDQGVIVWQDGRNGAAFKIYARIGVLDLEPPVARFTRHPTVGLPGTTFTFDARRSSDNATPPGALLVRWDWNSDGSWDTLPTLSKVATRTVVLPGTYTVTLGVWDLMLLSDTVSYPILVITPTGNTPPTATLSVTPRLGVAGTTCTADASGSSDAETPGSLQARWDWEDDGAWDTGFSSALSATHTFDAAGNYTTRVEVRDDEGLTDSALDNVTVIPGPVTALEVHPSEATLMPSDVTEFWATAWDSYGNEMSNPEVTWSLANPDAGTIDANGVFTAGTVITAYPDVIVGESDGISDTASVTILAPPGQTYEVYLPLVTKGYHLVVETELAYDDGTLDSTVSWETGRGYAVCFSPPGGSADIVRARYYLQDPRPIEVHVWSGDTHDDLLAPFQADPTQEGWNDVDLSAYSLTVSADFCVGFLHLEDYRPTLGVDTTAPDNQSYEVDGAYWQVQGYDAMIRVVVTEP